MSEIPELPARQPLSRPVPEGGLESAVRVGRRRRNRFLGAAGGLTTALVLVVGAGALSPSPTNDSLRFADPETSASPSQRPTQEEPTTDPSPQQEPPAATASPQPGSGASEQPQQAPSSPRPDAQPGPDQPGGDPKRRPYVEKPTDVAAPMNCQAVPNQPVITAGSSCSGRTTTTSRAAQGGRATSVLSYCVNYGEDDYVLRYDTGREHEVRVYRGEGGPLVYTFSDRVRYTQGAHTRRIPGGRCLEWTAVWDTTLADGGQAPPGEYWMMVTLEPDGVNDWPEGQNYGGGVGFRVTVTED